MSEIREMLEGVNAPSSYDFSSKMRENRAGWKTLKMHMLSGIAIPNTHNIYIRGLAATLTGLELIRLVEDGDAAAMNIMANKRVVRKYDVADVIVLKKQLLGNDELEKKHRTIEKECDALVEWMVKMHTHSSEADLAAKLGDGDLMRTAYAYEYAIGYYVKGKYDMLSQLSYIDVESLLL